MDEVDGNCMKKMEESNGNHSTLVETNQATNYYYKDNEDEIQTAKATIGPTDYYYKMDHEYRGLLIIFNQENFNKDTNQRPRPGTEEDVRKIKECFSALGFLIHLYTDMTLDEIQQHIRRYVEQDYYHKLRDCLAVFVLTHGDKDELWAKDACYNPAIELWGKFTSDRCPSLAEGVCEWGNMYKLLGQVGNAHQNDENNSPIEHRSRKAWISRYRVFKRKVK